MNRNNYHTHTVFCDGHDTAEDFVLAAIEQNCSAIGFTGHSFTDIYDDEPFCMTREGTKAYKAEILRLKQKYNGKIDILLGVEQDYYSDEPTDGYDYVIGSVHYVYKDGYYIPIDESKQLQIDTVNKYYGGDFYGLAEDYFALVGEVYEKTKCDIVGHFDLITKYNEGNCLFNTSHPRYVAAANKALRKLCKYDVIFEVNLGAVARGYRTIPYPDDRILSEIKATGKTVIYSSDAHSVSNLLFGIPDSQPSKEEIFKIK